VFVDYIAVAATSRPTTPAGSSMSLIIPIAVAIAVGGILVIVAIIIVICCCRRCRTNEKRLKRSRTFSSAVILLIYSAAAITLSRLLVGLLIRCWFGVRIERLVSNTLFQQVPKVTMVYRETLRPGLTCDKHRKLLVKEKLKVETVGGPVV